jgi:MoxR-like ATPase
LPEAQLDRFMFKLRVNYPERSEERTILERMAHPHTPESAVTVASIADIMAARRLLDKIYMDEKILEYILDIVIATRPGSRDQLSSRQNSAKLDFIDEMLTFGASPRAGVALSLAARGLALLNGRAYVLPQDVKELAPDVLRHRVILSYEAEAENVDSDAVIARLLAELRTP